MCPFRTIGYIAWKHAKGETPTLSVPLFSYKDL